MGKTCCRRLGIDVGIWNFSYCVVREDRESGAPPYYEIEEWEKFSIPARAGFPIAQGRIEADEICMTILSEMINVVLRRLFPPHKVRHTLDYVKIESQANVHGVVTKCGQLSHCIYTYFRELTSLPMLCCWRFPEVKMVSAQVKFTGGRFCNAEARELLKSPGKSYAARKAYSVHLVARLLEIGAVYVPHDVARGYRRALKKDDYCDAVLIASCEDQDSPEHEVEES